MPLFTSKDKDAIGTAGAVFTIVALVLGVVALFTAATNHNDGSSAAGGTSVALSEFALSPASVTVPVGGKLTVVNNGTTAHNLTIEGTHLKTKDLAAGDSEQLDLSQVKVGMYTMFCAIPGHKDQGMVGDLMVGAMDDHAEKVVNTDRMLAENDTMDKTMKDPTDAYVAQLTKGANTKGVGNVPLAPTVLADGTKQFTLTASIIDWQVDPDTTVQAWAYNGMVPGPWIKVDPGDKVQLVLKNHLPQSTVIHLHGIEVPNAMDGVPDVTQPPVKPGETFTYAFVAKGPALGMYHSHDSAEHQVPDGLFGVFQVGDVRTPCRHRPHFAGGTHGAERRGRDRPVAQRQVVPRHGTGDHAPEGLDADRLLQRRLPDPSDAPARCPAVRGREGRFPGAAALHGRHAGNRARGAVLGVGSPE